MLLEFKCKNYLSFKNEISLNLSTIKSYSEHKKTHIIQTKKKSIDLLKLIAVYGSNGGGKSNMTRAITAMTNLVHNSFKNSLMKDLERGDWDCPFQLSTETINEPSMFEMSFIIENVIFRYGFEIYNWEITNEWLYKTEKREIYLFKRNKNEFTINENSFPEGKKHKEVNSNVLFLSFLAQHNSELTSKIFSFFENINVVDGLNQIQIKHVTKRLLKENKNFKKWLAIALKFLDIQTINLGKDKELYTTHPVYGKNNLLESYTDFNLEYRESEGTKQLIYLLGAIYDTLQNGRVFFIDEFNSKFHPNLSVKLVKLFHEYNHNAAQFIITAHDPTLLDKSILRRDQVWFMDRNQFGVSELYPMSNFKASEGLRSVSDFRKKYLQSDFGAAESINFSEEFIKITNEL